MLNGFNLIMYSWNHLQQDSPEEFFSYQILRSCVSNLSFVRFSFIRIREFVYLYRIRFFFRIKIQAFLLFAPVVHLEVVQLYEKGYGKTG